MFFQRIPFSDDSINNFKSQRLKKSKFDSVSYIPTNIIINNKLGMLYLQFVGFRGPPKLFPLANLLGEDYLGGYHRTNQCSPLYDTTLIFENVYNVYNETPTLLGYISKSSVYNPIYVCIHYYGYYGYRDLIEVTIFAIQEGGDIKLDFPAPTGTPMLLKFVMDCKVNFLSSGGLQKIQKVWGGTAAG